MTGPEFPPLYPGRPMVVLPKLCAQCRAELILAELQIPESGPWMAAEVIAQLLLFQQATAEPSVQARAEHQTENLSLVLAEYGCLGCAFERKLYNRVVRILHRGLEHAARVSRGEVSDPDHVPLVPRA